MIPRKQTILQFLKTSMETFFSKNSDIVKKWAEHFRSVLSGRQWIVEDIEIVNKNIRKLNISVEEISVVETQRVIGEMKDNKTAAINYIPEELLEANIEATTIYTA